MAAPDLYIAASFWTDHRNEITAVATVLIALLLAWVVDRALSQRAAKGRHYRHRARALGHRGTPACGSSAAWSR